MPLGKEFSLKSVFRVVNANRESCSPLERSCDSANFASIFVIGVQWEEGETPTGTNAHLQDGIQLKNRTTSAGNVSECDVEALEMPEHPNSLAENSSPSVANN